DFHFCTVNSRLLRRAKIPLWNQYSGAGKPLAANQTSNAFSLIRYVFPVNFFPTPFMWDIFLLFRIFILIFFSFIFLKILKISTISALTSSVSLGFCGHILLYSNLFHLDVEIFLPLLFIGIELFFNKKENYRNLSKVIIPLSVFLLIIGGNIQASIINLLSGILYFCLKTIFLKEIYRKKIKKILFFIILYLLGIGISLFYLLPLLEFILNSFHVHSTKTGLQSFDLKTIPSLISPFIYGPVHSQWFIFSQHLLPSYLGLNSVFIFLIFCCLLFFNKKHNEKYYQYSLIFLIIFLVFFLKNFNIFPLNLLGLLPILNRIIFTKYIFPFYFSFYILLAIGIDNLNKEIKLPKLVLVLIFLIINLVIFLGIFEIIKYEVDLATRYIKLSYIFKHLILIYFLFFGQFIFLLGFSKNIKNKKTFIISLFIILEVFITTNILIKKKPNRYDSYSNPADFVKYLISQKESSKLPFRIYGIDRILISQVPAGFGIEDLRDLDALVLKNHWDFMRLFITGYDTGDYAFFTGGKDLLEKSLLFLSSSNVRFLLDYKITPNDLIKKWEKENLITKRFIGTNIIIYEINNFKNRIYIPKKIIKTKSDPLRIMKKKDFNPLETIVINSKQNKILKDLNNKCIKNLKVLNYDNDEMKIFINNQCDEYYVFISNTFYPGWKAYLDKKNTVIEKANLAFQAVKIPYGLFILDIKYEPNSFKFGIIFSLFNFVIFLTIIKLAKI
ncbi:MAG: YfhO family protein, partial [Candidatus Methanomethylicia archaeon]